MISAASSKPLSLGMSSKIEHRLEGPVELSRRGAFEGVFSLPLTVQRLVRGAGFGVLRSFALAGVWVDRVGAGQAAAGGGPGPPRARPCGWARR